MRSPVNYFLPLAAPIFLAACAAGAGNGAPQPAVPKNGPAADYPVVIGDPFTIGSKTYTPNDSLNYDAVGYAIVGGEGTGIAASHKTLPLPSYVEVTDLETGRTALIRVETRGPMRNDALLELTPAAAKQLGIVTGVNTPVRVRRVNPPEVERAMLRAGEQAPLRMDTPKALLAVLKRKLNDQQPLHERNGTPVIAAVDPDAKADPAVVSSPSNPAPQSKAELEGPRSAKPAATAPSKPKSTQNAAQAPSGTATGRYVQVGAFSTRERAQNAARPLGAIVSQSGKYWVVRLGPLDSAAATAAALERARKAGYRDAIVRRIH